MEANLVKVTAVVYLAATASFFYFVLRKDTAAKLPSLVLLVGFVFHTLALVARFVNEGFAAVAFMGEALLLKSWLIGRGLLGGSTQISPQRARLYHRSAGAADDPGGSCLWQRCGRSPAGLENLLVARCT